MTTQPELNVVLGTGPVGLAVMDELLARGKRVRLVNRSGSAPVSLPAGVSIVKGDATDPASVREVTAGAAVVYFCLNAPDYHKWHLQFPPLQAGVLAGLTGSADGVKKLVVMDNLYMYGPHAGKPLTEDMPFNATRGTRGPTRAQMARDLLAAHQRGEVRVVVGRAADFFGPRVGDQGSGQRYMLDMLAGKTIPYIGDPDLPHTFTYMPDIGKALVLLGETDDAYGQVWHLPNPQTITARQFIAMAGKAAGMTPKLNAMKKSLLRNRVILPALGLFIPALRGFGELLYQFDEPFIVDDSKFMRRFGQVMQPTPLDEAVRATMAWCQENVPQGAAAHGAAPARA